MTSPTASERRRTTTTPSPSADEQPDERAAHRAPAPARTTIPSSADDRADGEQARREQDAHLRDQRLGQRERGAERRRATTGSSASCHQTPSGVRQEDLRGEHEHEPVPRRRRPLQVGEVAARVLEQRPLVDHRQLEVRVGVVDRLPAGLGDDDERERDARRARAPGSTRRAVPAVAGDHRRRGRSCRRPARRPRRASTSVASTKTAIVRSRLAPISEKPFADVPGGGGDARSAPSASSPASASTSWPTPSPARRAATGTSRTATREARGGDRRREPVDDAVPSTSTALLPQSRRSSR